MMLSYVAGPEKFPRKEYSLALPVICTLTLTIVPASAPILAWPRHVDTCAVALPENTSASFMA